MTAMVCVIVRDKSIATPIDQIRLQEKKLAYHPFLSSLQMRLYPFRHRHLNPTYMHVRLPRLQGKGMQVLTTPQRRPGRAKGTKPVPPMVRTCHKPRQGQEPCSLLALAVAHYLLQVLPQQRPVIRTLSDHLSTIVPSCVLPEGVSGRCHEHQPTGHPV